jgi:hypothetical protein
MEQYQLVGRHRLERETKRIVARWIMFLRSSSEYGWPPSPSFLTVRRLLYSISGGECCVDSLRHYDSQMAGGEIEFWPFYEKAIQKRTRKP